MKKMMSKTAGRIGKTESGGRKQAVAGKSGMRRRTTGSSVKKDNRVRAAKGSAGRSTPESEGIRLNKLIADSGIASRRKVDEMIIEGRVTVNGRTVTGLGLRIDPAKDKVAVDGEHLRTSVKKLYILLNKPVGIITTVSDEKNRKTVIDLIKAGERVFPVGRLDYNTSGLLLLTNDGELANALMHPSGEMKKSYIVKLSKPLEERHRVKLSEGVVIDGRRTAGCEIRFPFRKDFMTILMTIHEGRNRQVRKMFEKYGYFVRGLDRTEYAGLKQTGLKPGAWRFLNAAEVAKLYRDTGLEKSS